MFSYLTEPVAQLSFRANSICMPDIDRPRIYNLTRANTTLVENTFSAVNSINVRLEQEVYREIIIHLSDMFIGGHIKTLYPPVITFGGPLVSINQYNNHYYNSSGDYAVHSAQWFGNVTLENIVVEYCDAYSLTVIFLLDCTEFYFNNITVINNDFTGTGTSGIIWISSYDQGSVTVNDLKIIDTKLGFRSGLYFLPLGSGHLTITN